MEKKTIDEMRDNTINEILESRLSDKELRDRFIEYGEQCRKEGFDEGKNKATAWAKEVLNRVDGDASYTAGFIEGRDKALEWGSKNAVGFSIYGGSVTILKSSILSGKTAKELQP